jgi:hypothetical protein
MSEISETKPDTKIDPVAFIVALIGAPVTLALGAGTPLFVIYLLQGDLRGMDGLIIFFIPAAAIFLGGIPYLLVGAPMMYKALQRVGPLPDHFLFVGLKANLATPVIIFLIDVTIDLTTTQSGPNLSYSLERAGMAFAFGLIFAPVWCRLFAILYRRLERSTSKNRACNA